MEHRHSLVIPLHFDGNNYAYWKVRMKVFLKSIDERVRNSVEYGWEKPTTPVNEWQTSQKEAATFNHVLQPKPFIHCVRHVLAKARRTRTNVQDQDYDNDSLMHHSIHNEDAEDLREGPQ